MLALEMGPRLFASAMSQSGALTVSTAPLDPALSNFRKALIEARDVLDTFVFAYPITASGKHDLWQRVRSGINAGYTAIGDFQDTGHVVCSPAVVSASRNKCLAWLASFLSDAQRYNYSSLFTDADPVKMYDRPVGELSDKYWRAINATPSPTLSGLMNLATLLTGMLDVLIAQLPAVQQITALYEAAQVNTLHEYKKQIRAVQTLYSWYPSLWNISGTDPSERVTYLDQALANVTAMYRAFDFTHTLALQPVFYASRGEELLFRASAVVAQLAWVRLSRQIIDTAWREQLLLLKAFVVTSEPLHLPGLTHGRVWRTVCRARP
jgi:hypothetical protein